MGRRDAVDAGPGHVCSRAAAGVKQEQVTDFVILADTMTPDTHHQSRPGETPQFYRITVLLPMCIRVAGDERKAKLTETSSTSSAGGIGVMVHRF